jgi:C-terminal processing protease CtpA/Prc
VKKVVVDMRFNTGGNLDIAKTFMEHLGALARKRNMKVYVITGRATFSAGLFHAMQLRQYANAILVGEPVGDELDFWSEGGNVVAPNSKLSFHYADRFHSMSPVERPELKEYLVTGSDLSVKNPKPDILVNMTVRDYLLGRDPALEAIVGKARR